MIAGAGTYVALGKVTVASAGTPVRLTNTQTDPSAPFACHGVQIQALASNTGKVYIGTKGLSVSSLAHCGSILPIPTTNQVSSQAMAETQLANSIRLDEIFIDVDVNDEGVLVSVLVSQ